MEEKKKVEFEEQEHHEHKEDISPELEALLHTDPMHGLTEAEHAERLAKFGLNQIEEKKRNPLLHFLSFFTGSIAYLIEIAFILSGVVRDWANFGIIGGLLIINAFIGWFEEAKAGAALDALKNTLALKSKVWRAGKLIEVESNSLVPGDVIVVRLGDIVPADARLLGIGVDGAATEVDLLIDQAGLTGESLPVSKNKGDTIYSSSICKQGQMMAVVTKTGENTFIGRAANLIAITNEQGHFQKIVNSIGNFLVIVTVVMVVIIFIYILLYRKARAPGKKITGSIVLDSLRDVVVLTVAAIPVGLPTVLSVTMAVGSNQLAKKQVIVKRLTAVEEMASVSILCSDKTGTLTLNKLTFDDPYLKPGYTAEDILFYSYLSAEPGTSDPIEFAVRTAATANVPILQNLKDHTVPGFKVTSFLPFNPSTKMTQATILNLETNQSFRVSKGAPQVIVKLVGGDDEATQAVNDLARRGLRALGVAITKPDSLEDWMLVGMISLLDPPRPDSAETIAKCHDMGVTVKMVTGDQLIIAKEVAHRLGMQRAILDATKLVDPDVTEEQLTDRCVHADGFAQVIPEHKYRVVELMQNRGILVGMTGDGVNDAPALKKANVGLSTIVDGIMTSRAIFQRMRSYALYRITSTVHFLLFFFTITLTLRWQMDALLLILIAVLNDAATIVIAFDNAQVSQRPDKWRIGQLITLSIILGAFLCALTYGVFFIARDKFDIPMISMVDLPSSKTPHDQKMQSIIYLNISSAPHFTIFSTRLSGFFWENLPSPLFFTAIMATQVFATIIVSVGLGSLVQKIGWAWGFSLLAVSLTYFVVLDFVKVYVMRFWSFEMTVKLWPSASRRNKLAQRQIRTAVTARVKNNVQKVRESIAPAYAASILAKAGSVYRERSQI
ncbi:hypothetical protein BB559_000538 [Furculomyces boomerangus]|uniref:Plasma membrane ATPase n=1 Tax=Furculomyces boomerangus TaxID=61424 RepID=A0A2T9Z4V3_9FUNG|nr:hypothetical protein BB559_000538 [Furculomyces boomerangus]